MIRAFPFAVFALCIASFWALFGAENAQIMAKCDRSGASPEACFLRVHGR